MLQESKVRAAGERDKGDESVTINVHTRNIRRFSSHLRGKY